MVDTEQEGWRGCSGSEGQPGTAHLSCQAQTLWVQLSCSVLRGLPWIREKRSHVRSLGACVPELCGLVCYGSREGREVSFHRGRRKAFVIGRTEDRVIAGWGQSLPGSAALSICKSPPWGPGLPAQPPPLLWSPCLWHTGYDCTFCMIHLTTVSPSSYKKTQETLSQAGQKTSAALSTVGSAISRKLGDMR